MLVSRVVVGLSESRRKEPMASVRDALSRCDHDGSVSQFTMRIHQVCEKQCTQWHQMLRENQRAFCRLLFSALLETVVVRRRTMR